MKNPFSKRLLYLFIILCSFSTSSRGAIEKIPAGSFIINMGVVPQTYANGIKPWGMIHDLVKNYRVQFRWVINPAKLKDGIDFSHNGVDYKGGTFIIHAKYRNATTNAVIAAWQVQGVVGVTTVSELNVDVTYNLKYSPRWTFDFQNGDIAQSFLTEAGIPIGGYPMKIPGALDVCNDLFVMPHADPTWTTHSNLYYWNIGNNGWIWAGCHAVSVLENLYDPLNPSTKMNFLSQSGLVPFGAHSDGSPPYSYRFPSDPEMQFMGIADGAMQNGSEQIFLPAVSTWRPSTKVAVYDPSQANVPAISPGEAGAIVYGRAFGDSTYGKIMYTGGHNIEKGTADAVAAMRAFFNFSFLSIYDKVVNFLVLGQINVIELNNYTYRASLPVGVNPDKYTYQWSSTCGGTFSNPTDSVTLFNTPNVANCSTCTLYCAITDSCGREYYQDYDIVVCPATTLSVNLLSFTGSKSASDNLVQWTTAAETNTRQFDVEYSTDGTSFTHIATITAQGTGTGTKDYSYLHQQVHEKPAYYRLKIIDNDGKYSYSEIIVIKRGKTQYSVEQVYPNPFDKKMTVSIESPSVSIVELTLSDISGKTVRNLSANVKAGNNKIELAELDNLAPGLYILRIRNDEFSSSLRLMKAGN